MKNLFDLLPEVFIHILDELSLSDVLSFRRACKFTRRIADDHIRIHHKTNREIIIGSEDAYQYDKSTDTHYKTISMASLLQSQVQLPSSRFTLKFDKSNDIFEDQGEAGNWNVLEFVEKYGRQITHLKMSRMTLKFLDESSKESQFYEGLPNLQILEVEQIVVRKTDGKCNSKPQEYFPSTLKNIESLGIDTVLLNFPPASCKDHFWNLLKHCNKLDTLRIPQFLLDDEGDPDLDWGLKYYIVGMLRELLHHLRSTNYRGEKRLKSLDIENFKHIHMGDHPEIETDIFRQFLSFCVKNHVKLLNVPMELVAKLAVIIDHRWWLDPFPDPDQKELLKQCVHSVIHASPGNFPGYLENLEKVSFRSTKYDYDESAVLDEELQQPENHPTWTYLTSIEVTVGKYVRVGGGWEILLEYLFEDCRRPLVTDLYLNYETMPADHKDVHVRLPVEAATACQNLTGLTINNWPDMHKGNFILWRDLTNLKQLSLQNLSNLGLECLTGPDQENPAFLKMTNLEKLSLLEIHKMPKLDDAVFQLIFRHLKVREFHLTSWEGNEITKVETITQTGIDSLLTGNFAKFIKTFPFDCWALKDMNQEEFLKLRDKFRPAYLL